MKEKINPFLKKISGVNEGEKVERKNIVTILKFTC